MSSISTDRPLVPGTPDQPDAPIVLVVDDNADVAEAMATDLRRGGLRVRTAMTAEYAIAFCETQRFDAVVIDVHPDDGYSEPLLEEAPDTGPAVIVSNTKPRVIADTLRRHKKKVFAIKQRPVPPSELVEVVREAVSASRTERNR